MKQVDNGSSLPAHATWATDAEQQLRQHARRQASEIVRLESENRKLKREISELKKQLSRAGTLPMRERKIV